MAKFSIRMIFTHLLPYCSNLLKIAKFNVTFSELNCFVFLSHFIS